MNPNSTRYLGEKKHLLQLEACERTVGQESHLAQCQVLHSATRKEPVEGYTKIFHIGRIKHIQVIEAPDFAHAWILQVKELRKKEPNQAPSERWPPVLGHSCPPGHLRAHRVVWDTRGHRASLFSCCTTATRFLRANERIPHQPQGQ